MNTSRQESGKTVNNRLPFALWSMIPSGRRQRTSVDAEGLLNDIHGSGQSVSLGNRLLHPASIIPVGGIVQRLVQERREVVGGLLVQRSDNPGSMMSDSGGNPRLIKGHRDGHLRNSLG